MINGLKDRLGYTSFFSPRKFPKQKGQKGKYVILHEREKLVAISLIIKTLLRGSDLSLQFFPLSPIFFSSFRALFNFSAILHFAPFGLSTGKEGALIYERLPYQRGGGRGKEEKKEFFSFSVRKKRNR